MNERLALRPSRDSPSTASTARHHESRLTTHDRPNHASRRTQDRYPGRRRPPHPTTHPRVTTLLPPPLTIHDPDARPIDRPARVVRSSPTSRPSSSRMASLSASTFTGVRVARDRAATRRATINTAVVARRTKSSAPSKKGAFKVRARPRYTAHATMRVSFLSRWIDRAHGDARSRVCDVDV